MIAMKLVRRAKPAEQVRQTHTGVCRKGAAPEGIKMHAYKRLIKTLIYRWRRGITRQG